MAIEWKKEEWTLMGVLAAGVAAVVGMAALKSRKPDYYAVTVPGRDGPPGAREVMAITKSAGEAKRMASRLADRGAQVDPHWVDAEKD